MKKSSAEEPVIFLLGNSCGLPDFEALAKDEGWIPHQEHDATAPGDAFERTWLTADRSTAIHLVDDPTPKQRFVVIYGPKDGDVALSLGARFSVETADDAFDKALLASTDDQRIDAAWQLAVVNKAYSEVALDTMRSLYDGADEAVRHAVVNGIGYRGWKEGIGFLKEVAESDPSAELRKNSKEIIQAWSSHRTTETTGTVE